MSVHAEFADNVSNTVGKNRLMRTKSHASNSNNFLITTIKSRVKEDFRTTVI